MSGVRMVALVFDVVGLGIALCGFRRTWLDHADGERFVPEPIRRALDWARRLFKRRRDLDFLDARSETRASGVLLDHLVLSEGMPDLTTDPVGFQVALERQLEQLESEARDIRATTTRQVEAVKADLELRAREAEQALLGVKSRVREVAVGGLRLEVVGWFLILVGTVIGAFA